jgi:hypothetical protein
LIENNPKFVLEMDVSDNVGNIARSTDSEESWTLVNNWLHGCLSNHASCSIHYLEQKLPTRLVAVGSTDVDLRLTLTANLPGDTPYLTLSHCWGGLEFKMLLSDNLRSLLQHIPADEFLTKTFHDAITITRRLGFKYIWIDSLCIIQNDNNDWEREAALMGNVYGGSSLNLAAVDAPNGDVGCFFHRYSTNVEACKIQISNFESRSARETWNCVPKRFWPNLTLDTVLGCRGWVFQETVLAPRTLYLGSRQLAWGCRKTEACETFPVQINTGHISPAATIEAWSRTNLLDAWDTIISDYPRRALSFPKDKFIALSGVSRLFATKFDASFVAGLWRKDDGDLERQLVWLAESQVQDRPKHYQAPSWSWASVEAEVALPPGLADTQTGFVVLVAVKDVSVTLCTHDPFGQISDGFLIIQCRAPVRVSAQQHLDTRWWLVAMGDAKFYARVYPDSRPHKLDGELLFLPILSSNLENAPQSKFAVHGIILKPHSWDRFSRVGYFGVGKDDLETFDHNWQVNDQSYHLERSDNRIDFGPSVASDNHGNLLYEITII